MALKANNEGMVDAPLSYERDPVVFLWSLYKARFKVFALSFAYFCLISVICHNIKSAEF